MDISCPSDKSESEDVSSFGGLQSSVNENQCFDSGLHDDLVNEVENTLAETLHIQEAEQVELAFSNGDEIRIVKEGHECESPKLVKAQCSQKFLNKCASFPCPDMMQQPGAASDEEDEEHETPQNGLVSEDSSRNPYARSISLPTPLKLVSAMKGSREKHETSSRKLSVSWAPDVYDPIPTSLSHTINKGGKKQQKYKNNKKNWKNGKKGQKGNSSRGNSGKDKKQLRKVSGNSNGYKSIDARERVTEPNDEFGDLVVGSSDSQSYCGTSFLKKSLANMHYPVAEAL